MSKPAKVHKIKAKVDPKSTKTSSKVTKIKASTPAKTAKSAKMAKSTAKTAKSAKPTATAKPITKSAKPTATAKTTKTVSATKTTAVTKVKAVIKSKTKTAKRTKSKKALAKALKPMVGFNRYLKNSWLELKKVHWPSRKSTWAMVFAVVSYSLFFLVLVLALDNFFSYIFKLMLK